MYPTTTRTTRSHTVTLSIRETEPRTTRPEPMYYCFYYINLLCYYNFEKLISQISPIRTRI